MQPQASGHWVVVQGTLDATLGGERRQVHAGQSIALAPGQSHTARNPLTTPLELIEVLLGSDLGEADAPLQEARQP
jgi:mannose-6-phosphate isomerase-like protein (cupin superfamily)